MRMVHTARLALLAAAVMAAPLAGQRAERFTIGGSPRWCTTWRAR